MMKRQTKPLQSMLQAIDISSNQHMQLTQNKPRAALARVIGLTVACAREEGCAVMLRLTSWLYEWLEPIHRTVTAPSSSRNWASEGVVLSGIATPRLYHRPAYLCDPPPWHDRVRLSEPISGPLTIGSGRHCGLGLFIRGEDGLRGADQTALNRTIAKVNAG
jgi:hypothetical protein